MTSPAITDAGLDAAAFADTSCPVKAQPQVAIDTMLRASLFDGFLGVAYHKMLLELVPLMRAQVLELLPEELRGEVDQCVRHVPERVASFGPG